MREWRRDFHRHPALGFEEHRTAAGRGAVGPDQSKEKSDLRRPGPPNLHRRRRSAHQCRYLRSAHDWPNVKNHRYACLCGDVYDLSWRKVMKAERAMPTVHVNQREFALAGELAT
jgi:hypothetical protein